MTGVRYLAAKALKGAIESAVTTLANKVDVYQALPEIDPVPPTLAILPGRMEFEPFQEDYLWGEDTTRELVEVGALSGTWELRLLAKSIPERETIEDLVMNVFMQRPGAPGTLVVSLASLVVRGVTTGYSAPITFTLDSEAFREEFAFSNKRWSYLDLAVSIPLLVLRDAVYDMDSLRLAFTEDLDSSSPDTDEVEVEDDGGLVVP